MLGNQKGLNPLLILLSVALLLIVVGSGVAGAKYFSDKANATEITAFKDNLAQAQKSYLTASGEYTTKPALKFDEAILPVHVAQFFKQAAYFSGITTKSLYEGEKKEYASDYDPNYLISNSSNEKTIIDKVLLEKTLNMNVKNLVTSKYLSSGPEDEDNYFMLTTTGRVYYVNEDMTIKEISDEAKRLAKDYGTLSDLTKVGSIKLEKDGKKMDKIISSVTNRDFVLYGGEGTMRLAKVVFSQNTDGTVDAEITDLSSLLQNNVPADAVTELRLVSNTSAVVHYYNSDQGKMVYQTITF